MLSAVVGAMSEEVARLSGSLERATWEQSGPFRWQRGLLDGHEVLLAECGIGKVNAAALTQALLAAGAQRVIFTGVAGALDPTLRPGDVVISTDAVQHDVDVTKLGYRLGEVPGSGLAWRADPALIAAAQAAAAELDSVNVVIGRVASGDTFVAAALQAQQIRENFGAVCAEMEGAAVAQICHAWGTPYVIVRSVSDSADHHAELDFRTFTELAARNAELVVRGLLKRSEPGRSPK